LFGEVGFVEAVAMVSRGFDYLEGSRGVTYPSKESAPAAMAALAFAFQMEVRSEALDQSMGMYLKFELAPPGAEYQLYIQDTLEPAPPKNLVMLMSL
jgi:hypothetical protein